MRIRQGKESIFALVCAKMKACDPARCFAQWALEPSNKGCAQALAVAITGLVLICGGFTWSLCIIGLLCRGFPGQCMPQMADLAFEFALLLFIIGICAIIFGTYLFSHVSNKKHDGDSSQIELSSSMRRLSGIRAIA